MNPRDSNLRPPEGRDPHPKSEELCDLLECAGLDQKTIDAACKIVDDLVRDFEVATAAPGATADPKAAILEILHPLLDLGDSRFPDAWAINVASIVTSEATPDLHSDDLAVDRFAVEMKAKLAAARAKGRGGWEDKADCTQQQLSDMLRAHVAKGDPRDVANVCMFLHQRGEGIAAVATPESGEPVAWIRYCTDGTYEGPLHNSDRRMDDYRRKSGMWSPLVHPAPTASEGGLREAWIPYDPSKPLAPGLYFVWNHDFVDRSKPRVWEFRSASPGRAKVHWFTENGWPAVGSPSHYMPFSLPGVPPAEHEAQEDFHAGI